jgi:hypothetical protein
VGISLSWKNNIDGLIVKLSKVCYAVTSLWLIEDDVLFLFSFSYVVCYNLLGKFLS